MELIDARLHKLRMRNMSWQELRGWMRARDEECDCASQRDAVTAGAEKGDSMIGLKKFVLIPRDALECMSRRFAELAEANKSASESCAEDGQTIYVVELRTVATRADRPVKLTKL